MRLQICNPDLEQNIWLIGNTGEFPQLHDKAVFCVWVGDLFDPSQLPEEGQQPVDVADNLSESTRVTEVLVPVAGDLWASLEVQSSAKRAVCDF